jgi:hypothetical protein
MARKKRRPRTIASTRITNEELVARLQDKGFVPVDMSVSEADFDATLENLMSELPDRDDRPHFYCRKCGQYHLKSHQHHSTINAHE